jgi:hypothetical protein
MDPTQSVPQVLRATDDNEAAGNIFYVLGGNAVIEARLARNKAWAREQLLVPMRDALHVRLHSNRQYPQPLIGESPLAAAINDINIRKYPRPARTIFPKPSKAECGFIY